MNAKNDTNVKEKAKNEDFPLVGSDEAGGRIDRFLKKRFPGASQGQIQKWLRTGQIRVNGKRAEAADHLQEGDKLRLPPQLFKDPSFAEKGAEKGKAKPVRNPEKLKALVLFEDDDVVVLNKPAGLAVQGGSGLKENLDDSLMVLSLDGKTRPKLVHRLDRDTSGVLLIARNDFAAARMAESFRSRQTQKIYWAVTKGVPARNEGSIDIPLIKDGQLMRGAERGDPKEEVKTAHTLYKTVEKVQGEMAFLALWPLTGRTHQLRVHLALLGTPIWGDPLYGGEKEPQDAFPAGALGSGLHLHARRLILPHPRRGVIDVTAPLGASMRKTWRWLHFDEKADVCFEDRRKERKR